jgi:hypothetical protein
MKKFNLPWPCLPAFLILVFFSVSAEVSPRLDPPRRSATGAVDLDLRGSVGANYAIDASTNLSTWFELFTGVATDGVFSIRHDDASNYPALFYRGRSTVDQLPPVTLAASVNSNTAVSSLMNLAGGSATLFGANGTRYTLTLPTNSMPEPIVFTMSEVTNVSNLPFAGPVIGAVRIEPGNLSLWGAATLEITFGPNVDRRKIASFQSRIDGSAFQLTPDRVGANRITIPVSQGGIYGSSIVTAAELADTARRAIGTPTAAAAGTKKLIGASATDCQAGKKAAAQALQNQIGAAQAARSQAAAVKLAGERQKELAGDTDDSATILADLADDICNFYQSDVAPHWAEATSNCAAGKVVSQFALSLARQSQLLGGDCIQLSDIPFCAMFGNCLNEIEECCNAGNRGSAKVTEVLSLERQDQLLGGGCISQARAQEVIDECSSNIWTGSFSLTVNGYTNSTVTSSSGTRIQIDSYKATFQGSVIESTESGSEAVGYIVQLRTLGQLTIDELHSDSFEGVGCSHQYTLQSDEVVVATNGEYAINFITQPGGSYSLFEFNRTPTTIGVGAKETEIDLTIKHSCDANTPDITVNNTKRYDTTTLGLALPLYQGTWTDENQISASQTAEDPEFNPALKYSGHWDFKRQKAPPP